MSHVLTTTLPANSQFCYTWVSFPYPYDLCVLYICEICYVYIYVYMYMYTYIVVFGILMEFVLYATIIAGTTHNSTTKKIVQSCDDDNYVFFILCHLTPLLFLYATKDCIRLNCCSTSTNSNTLYWCWQLDCFCDQTDTEKKNGMQGNQQST
jgi:hypothetical protein